MHGNVQHLDPAGLHQNPAYTQAVVVSGNATTIYVGGQNAVDASGNIVGKGDIRAQTEKALQNLGSPGFCGVPPISRGMV